jgi:hypothetical protein
LARDRHHVRECPSLHAKLLPAEPRRVSSVLLRHICTRDVTMNGIIYLVGLIVVIMFILSFLGLR